MFPVRFRERQVVQSSSWLEVNLYLLFPSCVTQFVCVRSQVRISSLQKLLWRLGGRCGSLEELESQLGGFLFEMSDVSDTLLNFVELCSVVDIFGPITEHAIDQAG